MTLTKLEELQSLYSDLFKDVNGYRPRHLSAHQWANEELLAKWVDDLGAELEEKINFEKAAEIRAIKEFEVRIETLIATGAKCRETAIRWLHDANETHGDNSYLCFLMGVPYGYINC